MKKITLYILLTLFISSLGVAQDVAWKKKNFKGQKKEYKSAYKEYKKGQKLMYVGKHQYVNALKHFKVANKFNPNNADLNYYIGKCIVLSIHKTEAVPYFEKAYQLNPSVASDIAFNLARAHHLNEDWDEAIKYYKDFEEYLNSHEGKDQHEELVREIALYDKHIEECKSGKVLSKNPIRVFIDNVGPMINTRYREYGPVITADNTTMYFTVRRPDVVGAHHYNERDQKHDKGEPVFFEDIMVSHKDSLGTWQKPSFIKGPINTKVHEATVSLSPDGQHILYYSSKDGGQILSSELDGDEWKSPKKLPKAVNSDYHETSAVYTADRKKIFFVTNKPKDNLGKGDDYNFDPNYFTHDIFYSEYDDEKEKWSAPKNMGDHINTKYNERGVFLHPDGKTLFFSSEGHNSMGGLDIFKVVYDEEIGKWSKPHNLGYPINTPGDDVFFALSADGRTGYYASANPHGQGKEDIYEITFLGIEKEPITVTEEQMLASLLSPSVDDAKPEQVAVVSAQTTILKGTVTDEITKEPVVANIELVDNDKGVTLATFKSNSKTGKFLVSLPSGKNYGIVVTATDYLFHSENFVIKKEDAAKTIEKNIELKKASVGTVIILKNVFFSTNKAELRAASVNELDRLVKLLKDNPTLEIEMGGHTDNVGTELYNQKLSDHRASAVLHYLTKKGIKKTRLTHKGYGETMPIDTNDTEEGRQNNRRTEFKITKK